MPTDDGLREAIEKRMLMAREGHYCGDGGPMVFGVPTQKAVSVCEAMIREERERCARVVEMCAESTFWGADAAAYFSKVREFIGESALAKALEWVAKEIRSAPQEEKPDATPTE